MQGRIGLLRLPRQHDVVFAKHIAGFVGEHFRIDESALHRRNARANPVVPGAAMRDIHRQGEPRFTAKPIADIRLERLLRIPMPVSGRDRERRDFGQPLRPAKFFDGARNQHRGFGSQGGRDAGDDSKKDQEQRCNRCLAKT